MTVTAFSVAASSNAPAVSGRSCLSSPRNRNSAPATPPPPPPTKEEIDALLRPLSAADRVAVLRHFDALAARPASADISSYGCLASIIGLAMLVLAPKVLPGLSAAMRGTLLIIGAALILGGIAFRAIAPAQRVRAAGQRAKNAIDWAAEHDPSKDRDRWLAEVVSALTDAFYSGGPWTVHTFDFTEARARLGTAMSTVAAVETLLRLERSIYPVFTEFGPAQQERDRTADSGSDTSSSP